VGWYSAEEPLSLDKLVAVADREMYRDKDEYYRSRGLNRESGPR